MAQKPRAPTPMANEAVGSPSSSSLVPLSLSLSLSYTNDVLEELTDMFLLSRGCDGVDACGWRMDVKLDCISDSGVQCGKHKCCSDFKHS